MQLSATCHLSTSSFVLFFINCTVLFVDSNEKCMNGCCGYIVPFLFDGEVYSVFPRCLGSLGWRNLILQTSILILTGIMQFSRFPMLPNLLALLLLPSRYALWKIWCFLFPMSMSYIPVQLSRFTKIFLRFVQPGYMLYDRVLRPAEVGVTVAVNNEADPEAWGVDL